MTGDETALRGFLLKGMNSSLLREMIGFVTERLTVLEVDGLTGAAYGERNLDHLA